MVPDACKKATGDAQGVKVIVPSRAELNSALYLIKEF